MTYKKAKKYNVGDVIEIRSTAEEVSIINIIQHDKIIYFEVKSKVLGLIKLNHKEVNTRCLYSGVWKTFDDIIEEMK